MFKASFDAQVENEVSELMSYHLDHHAVASTLKCYLRELREPLTTTALYEDWMDAVRLVLILNSAVTPSHGGRQPPIRSCT